MIYRGKVTAVTSTTATVLVPDLDPQQSFGPLSCVGQVPSVNDIVLVIEVGDNGSSLPDLVVVNPTTKSQLDAKVAGPSSSTDNAIARYDGATGKVVQNSGVIVDDSNNLTGVGNLTTSKTSAVWTLQTVTSGNCTLYIDGVSGSDRTIIWQSAATNRWRMGADNSGSSNFTLRSYSDDGATATQRLKITRSSGRISIDAVGQDGGLEFASGGPRIMSGANTPEGAVSAPIGSLWLRTNGGAGTTLYVKESGSGSTGWIAK